MLVDGRRDILPIVGSLLGSAAAGGLLRRGRLGIILLDLSRLLALSFFLCDLFLLFSSAFGFRFFGLSFLLLFLFLSLSSLHLGLLLSLPFLLALPAPLVSFPPLLAAFVLDPLALFLDAPLLVLLALLSALGGQLLHALLGCGSLLSLFLGDLSELLLRVPADGLLRELTTKSEYGRVARIELFITTEQGAALAILGATDGLRAAALHDLFLSLLGGQPLRLFSNWRLLGRSVPGRGGEIFTGLDLGRLVTSDRLDALPFLSGLRVLISVARLRPHRPALLRAFLGDALPLGLLLLPELLHASALFDLEPGLLDGLFLLHAVDLFLELASLLGLHFASDLGLAFRFLLSFGFLATLLFFVLLPLDFGEAQLFSHFLDGLLLSLGDAVDLVALTLLPLLGLVALRLLLLSEQVVPDAVDRVLGFIVLGLELTKNLFALLVLELAADAERRLSSFIAVEDLDVGKALAEVLDDLVVASVGGDVQQSVAGIISDIIRGLVLKEHLDAFKVFVRASDGKHNRRVSNPVFLEWRLLHCQVIGGLGGLVVDAAELVLQEALHDLVYTAVGGGADQVGAD